MRRMHINIATESLGMMTGVADMLFSITNDPAVSGVNFHVFDHEAGGGASFEFKIASTSRDISLKWAESCLLRFATGTGQKTFVRVKPGYQVNHVFGSTEKRFDGYVRFSVWPTVGEISYAAEEDKSTVRYLGLAPIKTEGEPYPDEDPSR